jgi:hypothetical protein
MVMGHGEEPRLAARIAGLAMWAFHGENDRNVPVQKSRDLVAAMKKSGGHPRYTEFPNAGHDIWDNVNSTPGLWDWLFEQRRDTVPVGINPASTTKADVGQCSPGFHFSNAGYFFDLRERYGQI